MWPIFTEDWGRWRSEYLKLSPVPFMDPVTNLPAWHMHADSPILLYGFSKEIVEYPGYWPPNIHVCGFWFLPLEWQFSCNKCRDIMSASPNGSMTGMSELCTIHADIQQFLMKSSHPQLPLFIGLSSIGSMGFLKNPHAFLRVLKAVLDVTEHRFILFSSGYEPLEAAIQSIACESSNRANPPPSNVHGTFLFSDRLYCFSGSIPYSWLFSKCAVAIHHGGSGSTAAALHAGIPQILCPFILDQFYWAERLHWIGVAPEPLRSWHLFPDNDDATSISQAADCLARAIKLSLSPEIKAQASKVADRISSEDGSQEALKVLKEKVVCPC
ncbi:UDP-Glycosyltransferase [Musa troglodytarum]|uniref:UDP-Glycosyltransferase n=1 Tax=Musa troglodytarum TaxID=320322 RepID=A0A9E7ICL0_9LILI|nr:UDP-Glycosyltransferase [Musa troglodytarum]